MADEVAGNVKREPPLSELEELRVRRLVDQRFQEIKNRLYAVAGMVAALLAILGGLLAWTIQAAAENTVNSTVEQQFKDPLKQIEKLTEQAVRNDEKVALLTKNLERMSERAEKARAGVEEAEKSITRVNDILKQNFDQVTRQLAGDDEFKKAVALEANRTLEEVRTAIGAAQKDVLALKKATVQIRTTTEPGDRRVPVTVIKGPLWVETWSSEPDRLEISNSGDSTLKSIDFKDGKGHIRNLKYYGQLKPIE